MDLRTKALSQPEQLNLDRQIRQPAIELLSSSDKGAGMIT